MLTSVSLLAAFFLLIAPAPAAADTLLVYSQVRDRMNGGESVDRLERTREVWLGEGAVQVTDGHGGGYLFQRGSDRLILFRHRDRTFEVLPASASLADIAPKAFRPYIDQAIEQARVDVTIEASEETKVLREWSCRKHILTVESRGEVVQGEAWTTAESEIDDSLFRQAEDIWYSFDPSKGFPAAWTRIDGLLVKMKGVFDSGPGTRVEVSQELVRIEKHAPDEKRFGIPDDYREIPLDTTRWMKISGAGSR